MKISSPLSFFVFNFFILEFLFSKYKYTIYPLIELSLKKRRVKQWKMSVAAGQEVKLLVDHPYWTQCYIFEVIAETMINGKHLETQVGATMIFYHTSANHKISEIRTWHKIRNFTALVNKKFFISMYRQIIFFVSFRRTINCTRFTI